MRVEKFSNQNMSVGFRSSFRIRDIMKTEYIVNSSLDAMSSYGKALVKPISKPVVINPYEIPSDETVSLAEAVSIIKDSKTPRTKMVNAILASTFETKSTDVVVNKQALYLIKDRMDNKEAFPEMFDVIRTAMNEKGMFFDIDKYDSMFGPLGNLRQTAKLKPISRNYDKSYREPRALRKLAIKNEIEKSDAVRDVLHEINLKDLMVSRQEHQAGLLSDLERLKESNQVSDSLYSSMKKNLLEENFDMKTSYNTHYAGLNECKNLKDVKERYPEISFPDKPARNPYVTMYSLINRLACDDFEKVSIGLLKKMYIDFVPKANITVELENRRHTDLHALQTKGFEYSAPSLGLKKFIEKSDGIKKHYEQLKKIEPSTLDKLAENHATKNSSVWNDYQNHMIQTWFPVRLISLNKSNPEFTKDLAQSYLYDLYLLGVSDTKEINPIKKYEDAKSMNSDILGVMNRTFVKYLKQDPITKSSSKFKLFRSSYDEESIANTFEKLNNRFMTTFFDEYWTPERREVLKTELQASHDFMYNKVNKPVKQITDKDVDKLIMDDLKNPQNLKLEEVKNKE